MGIGLGGFAQGFSQGFNQTAQTLMAGDRNQREAEAHKAQMEKSALELEEAKKEKAYKEELALNLKDLIAQRQGGTVGGEAVDQDGNVIGKMQFKNSAEANAALGSQGLSFKEGTVVEQKPMDDIEFTKKLADINLTTGYKYGKVSLEQIEQARRLGKTLDKENVDEAVRTWMMTGDKTQVAKVFNKGGKYKFDPNEIEFATVKDPDGIAPDNVVAYRIGEDGQKQEVFNYQNYRFAGISDDAYAQIVNQGKITAIKEKGDTFRTGAKIKSDEAIADKRIKADAGKEGSKALSDLNDVMKNRFSGIFRNPIDNAEASRQKVIEGEVGALAERYVRAGIGVQTAVSTAQQEVFKKYNVDTSELNDPKKK